MSAFSFPRAVSIAKKEFRHIRRDPFTLAMALGLPLALVGFFGVLLDFDIRHVPTTVANEDRGAASRDLLNLFSSSHHFDLRAPAAGRPWREDLEEGRSKIAVFVPPGFSREASKGTASVQVLVDGSDNQTTGILGSYLGGLQRAAARREASPPGSPGPPFRTRFLFNPELNSRWFVVTGLFVVAVGVLAILLTALTVAREWETGSMELLLSTPVRPLEIVLGKILPYMALCLIAVGLVYGAARWGFGIPFRGSLGTFLLACVLFLGCALAQGLLISIVTRQQQLAMQLSNITGLLPATLLSGFIFPVASMPPFFQGLTVLLPPRWFIECCRGVFLKGAGLRDLALPLGLLAAIATGLVVLATRRFKRDLEP